MSSGAYMDHIFEQTRARLAEWSADPDVLGGLLVGSKSRGHDDELWDDDLEVLVADDAFARLAPTECGEYVFEGEGAGRRLIYDAQYPSLSDLRRKAGSPLDLDRWPYERAGV